MADKKKISFATKYISNKYFLNEVSVEGKKSRKLNFRLGNFRYLDDSTVIWRLLRILEPG